MVITTSGSIASFKTPVKQPLKSLKVYFSPIQNGSGDPSPTNVRPITGRTELEVTRCGKNMFNFDPSKMEVIKNGDGNSRWGYFIGKRFDTVTLSATANGVDSGTNFSINACLHLSKDGNGSALDTFIGASGTIKNRVFKKYESVPYVTLLSSYSSIGDTAKTVSINKILAYNIQFELGSTVTTYEPYSGTTVPVDWTSEAGTLYGGYVDLISGELFATHKVVTYTGASTETWIKDSSLERYIIGLSDVEITAYATRIPVISNIGLFRSSGGQNFTIFAYQYSSSGNKILYYYPPSVTTDVSSFRQWLSENNLQICYKLATPIVYQLSPIQIETLIGRNNIFSDGDTVEAVYDHVDTMNMVRLRQKALKGCQIYKTVLPPGYEEYDYLQTVSHNAKINTGVSGANATLAMDFEHMIVGKGSTYGSYYGLLGNGDPSSGEMYWCIRRYLHSGDTNFTKWGYCNLGNSADSRSISPCGAENTIIDKRIHYTLRFGELTTVYNGQTVTVQKATQNNEMYDSPIFIGTTSATSSGIASTIGRFYGHFKIWSGGKLIREYVPAVRLSDNKAGFYDLVNYTFNPSIGSADFVAGNDIGGLYVYADNSRYYEYVDDTVDANVTTDSNYFLTGFYDTGSDAAKSYTVPVLVSDGHVCARLFNDKAASSVDYFNISTSYDTRTYTGPGRYIMATVYKPRAADFYIYDNTNSRYIVKGSNVT